MFFIFSLVSALLHTNFQGKSFQCNDINDPCNYENVQKQMSHGDTIIITDKNIFEQDHLDSFHNLSSKALSMGISLRGLNTTINGTLSNYYFPAFISFQSSYSIFIEYFTFISFSSSIFHCKSSATLLFSYCDFHNNHVDNKLSILIFETSSKVVINHTIFSILTSHNSSIFLSNLSSIVLDSCTIDKAFTFHSSKHFPIFLLVQSQINIMNSKIIQSQAPYSPFFILKNSSNVLIENTSFLSNQNTIIFKCKEANSIIIRNSFFYDNMGCFIKNDKQKVELRISNTRFEQNFSPTQSFINLLNSSVHIYNYSSFISNSGHSSLIHFSGPKSLAFINETAFLNNQNDDSIIKCTVNDKMTIYSCMFNNSQSKNAVIMGNHSYIKIDQSHFYRSWSLSIMTVSCEIHLLNSLFTGSETYGKLAISSLNCHDSKIFNSSFNDNSLSFLIKLNGSVTLKNLNFNSLKEYAISKNLLKNCQNCQFLEEIIKEENYNLNISTIFTIVLPVMIFVLILFIFRKRFFYFWRISINKKIKD
ncbi:hypothetical protein M9Y10_028318 [Tritrichomonas musculus]|uniref:Right handed beta helix domain-containing protein n=1 Tax=Tritrichomonas musculus TaxID=1915356 RepID=A0ABR2KIY3_9EUKA